LHPVSGEHPLRKTEIRNMLSIRKLFERSRTNGPKRRGAVKAQPDLEALESRVVLYTASGNAWPHPQLVTISFMPDGTAVGDIAGLGSNLFAKFNANPRLAGQWQNQILRAAQVWAQQTNINLVVVPDNGADLGSGDYQQGDPGFGDIRIGGYAFGDSTLARAYMPPPVNNFSIAGDIAFNTNQNFSVGSTYDLFTVAAHEFGHALGLYHTSTTTLAEMFPSYTGVKPNLNADDIAGIDSIYGGARHSDGYDAASSNGTFSTATSLNSTISPTTLTALVQNLDITTTADVDDYKFNVPSGTNGTMALNVQSSGLSMLSPKVTVYASDQTTVLATADGTGQHGTTLSLTVPGVVNNQQLYVKVQGADTTAFSTGAYAMTLQFGTTAPSPVPLPTTLTLNGNPLAGGGGQADSVPGHGHENKHWDAFPGVGIHGLPHGPAFVSHVHRRLRHAGHRRA
jgi:hypothetical protein